MKKHTIYKQTHDWGNSIEWSDGDMRLSPDPNKRYRVYGFKLPRPEVGDLMESEFQKTFVTFVFVDVELMHDPKDMFFAEVMLIKQSDRVTKKVIHEVKHPLVKDSNQYVPHERHMWS